MQRSGGPGWLIKNKFLPLPCSPQLPLISTPLLYITVEAELVPYLEVEGIHKNNNKSTKQCSQFWF